MLENAWRPYTFPWMVDFLRGLRDLKLENSVYNFDFMAFGVFNQTKRWDLQLWTPSALEFFQDFVNSWFADSFSLYMLELFEHQKWKKNHGWNSSVVQQSGLFWNEDEIYEEFDILKNIIQEWWYKRYEISNFAAVGKSSIHNRVYREMEDYLWLWLSASSFINAKSPYFWAVVEKLKIPSASVYPAKRGESPLSKVEQKKRYTRSFDLFRMTKWNTLDEYSIFSKIYLKWKIARIVYSTYVTVRLFNWIFFPFFTYW